MTERESRSKTEAEGWSRFIESRMSRRTVIRGGVLGVAGLGAAALIGCGDDDDDDDDDGGTATPTATATATATAAAGDDDDDDDGGAGAEADYITQAREQGARYAYNWPEPDKTPVAGGTFKYGATFIHGSFDHLVSGGGTTQLANTMVGDQLVGYHHGPDFNTLEMELDPDFGLSTSWEVAPDGLTLTFNLREANFHNVEPVNGRALVAQDVALAYGRMQTARQSGQLAGLGNVEAVDDRTVKFNMDRPNADILIVAGNRELPIYPQEMYDSGNQDTDPIGTGAGILDKDNLEQDQLMPFLANPDYWGGKPLLDGFDVLTIQDAGTRNAAFRTGQTHYALRANTQPELDAIFDDVPNMNVMHNPSLMGIQINAVNSNVPPFDDQRVRRALKLWMDVDRYLAILRPDGWPDSLPAFGWPFYSDTYPGRSGFGDTAPFAPEESVKLLAAAGVEDGFKVEWRTPEGFAGRASETDLIIEDMREIGLDFQTLPADGQAFSQAYYSQGFSNPDTRESAMLSGWSTASPTANGYFWENIHSESSSQHFNVLNQQVDDLADKMFANLDPVERRQQILAIMDIFNEEAYFMDKVPASSGRFEVRPEVRFWRFHGPYIGIHGFWDWGYGFHKGWLDPDPPEETLTIDLQK